MGNVLGLLGDQQGREASSTIVTLKTPEIKKIVEKKIVERKKKPKTKKKNSVGDGGKGKEDHDHHEHGHTLEGHNMGNVFALLDDQQGKEASTIIALKITEVKKIAEEKKIAEINKKIAEEKKKAKAGKKKEKKKQKKSFVMNDEKGLDSIVVDQRYNDHERNIHSDSHSKTGDEKATQEHKAVNHHGNKNQAKASIRTVVLTKEELRERVLAKEKERKNEEAKRKERWLAREAERQERREQWLVKEAKLKERQERLLAREVERNERLLAREAKSKEQRLAREEERKKEMARKTLKEYEEQKAYEKQKAEKASLSVPETPLREATLDNIYTTQKSKDEMVMKDSNTKKYRKVRKTMNIEEFLKIPTKREGQDNQNKNMGEDSGKNTNGKSTAYSRTRATDKQEYALPDMENTVNLKAEPALDLSEASFPVLGKVTKPLNLF